jgi:hypothetical protein
MAEPQLPKNLEGHKGMAQLLKYLIELEIYKKMKEQNLIGS